MINRTWVRILGPPCICYIFSTCYPMQTQMRSLPCSLIQSPARWPQARSGGPDGMPTILPSQCAHVESEKVSQAKRLLGHKLAIQTSKNQAQTLSSLFIFYSCFYLIILIILLTNQLNLFFLIKLKKPKIFSLLKLISSILFLLNKLI